MLYVGGSHAIGVANRLSDLDLFLICDRDINVHAAFDNVVYVGKDDLAIDLEWWRRDSIESRLIASNQAFAAATVEPRRALSFNDRDLEFLHRLAAGIPLSNPEGHRQLSSKVNLSELAFIAFARAYVIAGNEQQDMAGFLGAGEYEAALAAMRRLVDAAVGSVLAALRVPTARPKWQPVFVHRLAQAGWDTDLPGGPLPKPLALTLARFYRAAAEDATAIRALTREAALLAHRLIAFAQEKIVGALGSSVGDEFFFRIPDRPTRSLADRIKPVVDSALGPSCAALAPDIRLHFEAGKWRLASYSKQEAIEVPALTAEALWHFNGQTPVAVVAAHLQRFCTDSVAELSQNLVSLGNYLTICGFTDRYLG